MIDLNTCTRPEFIEAWEEREKYVKHLEDELHIVNQKLQEYEGIQTDEELIVEVDRFLEIYGSKINRKQVTALWKKLTKRKKNKIWKVLPLYLAEFPDPKFRKTPDKWLRHEKYNDVYEAKKTPPKPKGAAYQIHRAKPIPVSDINVDEMMKKLRGI